MALGMAATALGQRRRRWRQVVLGGRSWHHGGAGLLARIWALWARSGFGGPRPSCPPAPGCGQAPPPCPSFSAPSACAAALAGLGGTLRHLGVAARGVRAALVIRWTMLGDRRCSLRWMCALPQSRSDPPHGGTCAACGSVVPLLGSLSLCGHGCPRPGALDVLPAGCAAKASALREKGQRRRSWRRMIVPAVVRNHALGESPAFRGR
jgi:hypothetical protein